MISRENLLAAKIASRINEEVDQGFHVVCLGEAVEANCRADSVPPDLRISSSN